jgi:cell division FtsZ-interacting protein ZapD
MSDDSTYIRAKFTEINKSIERLTETVNKMVDAISIISEVRDEIGELRLQVAANGERLQELKAATKQKPVQRPVVEEKKELTGKQQLSNAKSVLENLESQVKNGAIASELANRISEAADSVEKAIGSGSLTIKMDRWRRILKTYSRVDSINPNDIMKLKADIRDWIREIDAKQ